MSYRDFLATLIAEEVAHRAQTRIERSVRKAHFPFLRTIEEFDFTFQTSISSALLGQLPRARARERGKVALILFGPTGPARRTSPIAIAYRAIQNGRRALRGGHPHHRGSLQGRRQGGLGRALQSYVHPTSS